MSSFRPTQVPPGRLVRLGIVLDARNSSDRLREVARMCDRAGIDALWVHDDLAPAARQSRLEAWTALVLAGVDSQRTRMGAMLDVALRPASTLAAMARTLDAALSGRLEVGFTSRLPNGGAGASRGDPVSSADRARRVKDYGAIVRGLVAAESNGPPLWIEMLAPPDAAAAVEVADNVLVPAMAINEIRAAIEQVGTACAATGRDPSSLGIGVELPVSIGRTSAEARARADAEGLFQTIGHSMAVGLFGTLEQCQSRVIELAHLGITDLHCVLPNTADVQDVIAQLTAIAVGTTQVLTPNAPRSRAPAPPEGWGGRRPGQ